MLAFNIYLDTFKYNAAFFQSIILAIIINIEPPLDMPNILLIRKILFTISKDNNYNIIGSYKYIIKKLI